MHHQVGYDQWLRQHVHKEHLSVLIAKHNVLRKPRHHDAGCGEGPTETVHKMATILVNTKKAVQHKS